MHNLMLISIYLFINRYTINHKFLTIKKFIIIIFENMYLFLISKKLIYIYIYIVTFLMISLLYYNNDYIYNNNDIMISSYLINALYNLLFIYFFYYLC